MNLSTKSAHLKSRVLEIVWVLSGQAVSIFGALAGIRILAAVLQPAGFGELTLAIMSPLLDSRSCLVHLVMAGNVFSLLHVRPVANKTSLLLSLYYLKSSWHFLLFLMQFFFY